MGIKVDIRPLCLRVAEIEKSIRLYELLGSAPTPIAAFHRMGCRHCEDGSLAMFLRAGHRWIHLPRLWCCTCTLPDLTGLRERLLAGGVNLAPINHPEYSQGQRSTSPIPMAMGTNGARSMGETA